MHSWNTSIVGISQVHCTAYNYVSSRGSSALFMVAVSSIDNKYYVTGRGNIFTILIETCSVTSSNLKPCPLNVNGFF